MDDYGINSRLREWMEVKRYSNNDLAEWTGISRSAVSQIMRDKMNLSVETITKILTANPELCPSWFLMGRNGMDCSHNSTSDSIDEVRVMNEERNLRLRKDIDRIEANHKKHVSDLERLLSAKEEIIGMLKKQIDG